MANRHWQASDFVRISRYLNLSELQPDGTGYGSEQGYCRKCQGDMSRFLVKVSGGVALWGPLHHYNSHKHIRQVVTITQVRPSPAPRE